MKTNTLGVSCSRILESVGMRNLVLGCAIASLFQIGGVTAQAQNVKPKSVIRISLCRTAKRNPLIFPI